MKDQLPFPIRQLSMKFLLTVLAITLFVPVCLFGGVSAGSRVSQFAKRQFAPANKIALQVNAGSQIPDEQTFLAVALRIGVDSVVSGADVLRVEAQRPRNAMSARLNIPLAFALPKFRIRFHSFATICLALIIVWLVICPILGILAIETILHPERRPVSEAESGWASGIAERYRSSLTEVSVQANDGAQLLGWWIVPALSNGYAVILLHSQAGNRAGMLGPANMFLRYGYMVLLPDARAHGASGGAIATYGLKERSDILLWVEWIRAQGIQCVCGLGDSMGGAHLLQSLAVDPGFSAVIADSPFASFREASYDQIGQWVNVGRWAGRTFFRPAVECSFLYARWRYGVDLAQAAPERTIAASCVPIFLIHGLKDKDLSHQHSERIVALNSGIRADIDLWKPAEADHCGAWKADPSEYERRLIDWFTRHRTESGAHH